MTPRIVLPLALAAPLLLAWNGGGSGRGTWSGPHRSEDVPLSAVVRVDAAARLVVSLPAGDEGDALVFVTARFDRIGTTTRLPAPGVSVAMREYGADGRLRAWADDAATGAVTIDRIGERWTVEIDASWRGHGVRTLDGARVDFEGPVVDTVAVSSGGEVVVGSGCDDDVAPEPEPVAGSGCEGDDWSDDDGWSDDEGWSGASGDESTGCEGDDVGGSDWSGDSSGGCEGGDSGGGCEGDDLGGASSCEGDALASSDRPRRSPTIVRLLNQLPWFLVLLGISVARRRPRRRSEG